VRIEGEENFMRLPLLLVRSAVLVLAGVLAPIASAVCQVPQPRVVCAEYSNSKAVVIATLRASRFARIDSDTDGHLYDFVLKTLLRGNPGSAFEVWEENSSGRATFDWKARDDYLLFLARNVTQPTRAWVIDGCGNSGPTSQSGKVLAQIKSIDATTPSGVVYGMVSTESWTTGVSNVMVKAIGNSQTFTAKTDEMGRFMLRLPIGKYALGATQTGWSFAPEPFGYESPQDLNITSGYCAQVQFSSTGK
jgi:hypothetical protein